MAAKTKNELLYVDELERLVGDGFDVQLATDDGSAGFKGIATDAVREIFQNARYDTIYTCGPELMMAKLHMFAKEMGINIQASLERFMKCGCGICGTCALDSTGDLVCVEGPVFTGDRLNTIEEFGKYHRDSTGVKIQF
jgi:dihydroorotate dehydrogenase electron transfer subunit